MNPNLMWVKSRFLRGPTEILKIWGESLFIFLWKQPLLEDHPSVKKWFDIALASMSLPLGRPCLSFGLRLPVWRECLSCREFCLLTFSLCPDSQYPQSNSTSSPNTLGVATGDRYTLVASLWGLLGGCLVEDSSCALSRLLSGISSCSCLWSMDQRLVCVMRMRQDWFPVLREGCADPSTVNFPGLTNHLLNCKKKGKNKNSAIFPHFMKLLIGLLIAVSLLCCTIVPLWLSTVKKD